MKWPEHIKEYARVKMETEASDTQIAKFIRDNFGVDKELESIRGIVKNWRKKWKLQAKKRPYKRLFFDIETTYNLARVWQCGKQWVRWEQIKEEKKVLCIAYKWQGEDKVHCIDWNIGEAQMLTKFIKIMGKADEVIGHNGDNFDIKELRTRCIKNNVLMFPNYRTLDTLKKARQFFKFPQNRLDCIGQFLGVGQKIQTDFQLWIDCVEGKGKVRDNALRDMKKYCMQDVLLLEAVYKETSPYIYHNNHFAVLTGGKKWDCPECTSKNTQLWRTHVTPFGYIRKELRCMDCKTQFKISNRDYERKLEKMQ